MTAEELFAAGYRIVSRRHGIAARVPPGETAKAAVARHDPRYRKGADEYSAADTYRRCYAERDGQAIQVSSSVMRALVKLKHAEDDVLLQCSVDGCKALRQYRFISEDGPRLCSKHAREAKDRRRR